MIGQLFYIMREETKQKIFIIGCGGTGSNYIKELARYLATNRNYMINADVILIDGDTVEEKNLERQSFYSGRPTDEQSGSNGISSQRYV